MLVRARDEDGGPGLGDDELRAEVMTIFVGGYETSSNALAFTLALLAQHPEVESALAPLAGAISDEDMRRLNYSVDGEHRDATQVVKEFLQQRKLIP